RTARRRAFHRRDFIFCLIQQAPNREVAATTMNFVRLAHLPASAARSSAWLGRAAIVSAHGSQSKPSVGAAVFAGSSWAEFASTNVLSETTSAAVAGCLFPAAGTSTSVLEA